MFKYEKGWIIKDTSFDYDSEYTKASVYAMANGYMGNRGTLEEIEPKKGLYVGNYINGIYDAPNNLLKERETVNIQNWCSIKLWIDNELFDLNTGTILSYKRWMDLREPILNRKVKWESPSGKIIILHTERFISMVDIHCGFIKWHLEVLDNCEVIIESGIEAEVMNIHMYHFKDFITQYNDDYIYLETVTKEMDYHIGSACSDSLKVSDGVKFQKKMFKKNRKDIHNRYKLRLNRDEYISLKKIAVIYSSQDVGKNVQDNCIVNLKKVAGEEYENIKKRHIDKWKELWEQTDMKIKGDDKAQIGIRFSIYHLLNSAPYHSNKISYPARSLSGQDHRGSIFWDTEIFIAPFFIYNLPEIARNMLMYRYNTLDGAKRKAESLGFNGAYYAWESHETGDDKCHSRVFRYAKTGRLMVNHFWDAQIHVSADISYCIWQYYQSTGDLVFLINYGLEMVCEISRFFISRAIFDKRKKVYMIRKVLGPDEYHELIDNNAFTNVMVKEAILRSIKILDLIKIKNNNEYYKLVSKIGLKEEDIDKWKVVYENLYEPIPNHKTNLIEQFSKYFTLEDCSVEEVKSRRLTPSEYLGGWFGICAKTQIIKQADVIMLLYLMRDKYNDNVKEENWKYYEPRTEHGSSLSTMAYALVAADINMMEWSYKYFLHTAFMDLEARGIYSNHGVHPCSLGGAWLTIVNGFCGITLKEDGIHWRKPHIPELWKELDFKLQWHSHIIRFIYKNNKFQAQIEGDSEKTVVPFHLDDTKVMLNKSNKLFI